MTSLIDSNQVVFFFSEQGISKGMLYRDFEAVLDGMVGLHEFAGQKVQAAYVLADTQLKATGIALFYIGFDQQGAADRSWNIPLRHLLEKSESGPDMGAGAVQLVCASQCPVDWLSERLWDPSMKRGNNTFVHIRDMLSKRGPMMGLEVSDDPVVQNVPVMASEPVMPVVEEVAPAEPQSAPSVNDALLERKLGEYVLQIATMEKQYEEEIAQLKYGFEKKESILSSQLEKVMTQLQAVKSQNAAVREQASAQKSQIISLQESLSEQLEEVTEHGRAEIAALKKQYETALGQRLDEETAKLTEKLHIKELEILEKDEKNEALLEMLEELRSQQSSLIESSSDKFLKKLEDLGLSFIAFHEGAGHISIPFNDISKYADNPSAYAAEKCRVTLDHYNSWLEHYENSRCQHEKPGGHVCSKRVVRIESPSRFKKGDSDVCLDCSRDKTVANVISYQ